jgi:hypothetical protein
MRRLTFSEAMLLILVCVLVAWAVGVVPVHVTHP